MISHMIQSSLSVNASEGYLYIHIHKIIIYNNQELEACDIYMQQVLFTLWQEGDCRMCYHICEIWGHYAKWDNSHKKKHCKGVKS